jgi:hypothetical protein
MLVDAVREVVIADPMLGALRLRESTLLVSQKPREIAVAGKELVGAFSLVLSRSFTGSELLSNYGEIEAVLRGSLGASAVLEIEQASYSLVTSESQRLYGLGSFKDASDILERWLSLSPDNTFYLAVLAELIERHYQTRAWEGVVNRSSEFIATALGEPRQIGDRSGLDLKRAMIEAGVDPDLPRVRLLLALGLEAVFRFSDARAQLVALEADENAGENAVLARSILLDRHLEGLPAQALEPFLNRSAGAGGGLTMAEREHAHLQGLKRALAIAPQTVRVWVDRLRAFVTRSGDDAGPMGRIVVAANDSFVSAFNIGRSADTGLATQERKALFAIANGGGLSPQDQVLLRSLISGLLVSALPLSRNRAAEASNAAAELSSLPKLLEAVALVPPVWVNPYAGHALARYFRASAGSERIRVTGILTEVLRASAALETGSYVGRKQEMGWASALLQVLVNDLGYRPRPQDVVELVGPSRPLRSEVVPSGLSRAALVRGLENEM